jgi:hypothetical protein
MDPSKSCMAYCWYAHVNSKINSDILGNEGEAYHHTTDKSNENYKEYQVHQTIDTTQDTRYDGSHSWKCYQHTVYSNDLESREPRVRDRVAMDRWQLNNARNHSN